MTVLGCITSDIVIRDIKKNLTVYLGQTEILNYPDTQKEALKD